MDMPHEDGANRPRHPESERRDLVCRWNPFGGLSRSRDPNPARAAEARVSSAEGIAMTLISLTGGLVPSGALGGGRSG
jgi:hypothetical protein